MKNGYQLFQQLVIISRIEKRRIVFWEEMIPRKLLTVLFVFKDLKLANINMS